MASGTLIEKLGKRSHDKNTSVRLCDVKQSTGRGRRLSQEPCDISSEKYDSVPVQRKNSESNLINFKKYHSLQAHIAKYAPEHLDQEMTVSQGVTLRQEWV
jgi:hypothetical protein